MVIMQRKSRIILLILTIVVVFILGSIALSSYRKNIELWEVCADFENYSEEFNVIKDFVVSEYPNEEEKWLGLAFENESGRGIYDPDCNDIIECPQEVIVALNTIYDLAFSSEVSILEAIRINENKVYFCISSEDYALVFSTEDELVWYDELAEEEKLLTKEISGGWYHVRIKETK